MTELYDLPNLSELLEREAAYQAELARELDADAIDQATFARRLNASSAVSTALQQAATIRAGELTPELDRIYAHAVQRASHAIQVADAWDRFDGELRDLLGYREDRGSE